MSNIKTPGFFLSVLTQSMFPHPASPFETNLLVLLVACYGETAAFVELLWTESFLHVIDSSYGQLVINVCELSHSSEMMKSPFKWSPSLRLCIMDILSLALNLKHQLLWVSLHPWPDFLTDLWHCFGNLLHNHRVASQGDFFNQCLLTKYFAVIMMHYLPHIDQWWTIHTTPFAVCHSSN